MPRHPDQFRRPDHSYAPAAAVELSDAETRYDAALAAYTAPGDRFTVPSPTAVALLDEMERQGRTDFDLT